MTTQIPEPFGRADLTIAAGASFEMPVTWSSKSTGQVIDLTGYTARMQIREEHASAAAEIELTTANGRIVIDGPAGKITLKLSDAETAALAISTGVYDLELVSPASVVTRLLAGTVHVSPEATR